MRNMTQRRIFESTCDNVVTWGNPTVRPTKGYKLGIIIFIWWFGVILRVIKSCNYLLKEIKITRLSTQQAIVIHDSKKNKKQPLDHRYWQRLVLVTANKKPSHHLSRIELISFLHNAWEGGVQSGITVYQWPLILVTKRNSKNKTP